MYEQIGPYGGDVRALLTDTNDPDISYLGSSDGKIYKTVDAGHTWFPLKPGIGRNGYVVDTLVQHPNDSDHLYAGAWDLHSDGGGLFQSLNAGLSWERIPLPQDSSAVRGLAVCRSDPDRMVAGTLTGVFVSDDGGFAWNQVGGSLLQKTESVAIDPVDCGILYVGTWRLGYRSNDFGTTWTRISKGMPLDSDLFSITVSSVHPEIVYAGACSGVYRSSTRASQWNRLRVLTERFSIRAHILSIDPVVQSRIYAGTTEGLFVSHNDGKNWKRLTKGNVSVNAVQVNPSNNNQILIGTEYKGVMRSEDGGRSWSASNTGFIHQKISWILPDPEREQRYILGAHSGEGGLYRFDSVSGAWKQMKVKDGTRVFSYLVLPGNRGRLAGTSQGVYLQTAEDDNWRKLDGLISGRTVYSLALDAANRFVFAGTDQGIYRTSVDTLKFKLPVQSRLSPKVWCILAPMSSSDVVYAGTSLGLLRSWDKGTTWHILSATGLPDRVVIRELAVSSSNNERILAATSAGLLESENGGIHWKRMKDRALGVDIASVLFTDETGQRILAAGKTAGGAYYSTDGGKSWNLAYSPDYDSPANCIIKVSGQPHQFLIGTQADGVYLLDLK